MEEDQPKSKRGRPRKHKNRQAEWKQKTGFEQTEARRKYKAEWAKKRRQQKNQENQE